jgi:hypothetical protein
MGALSSPNGRWTPPAHSLWCVPELADIYDDVTLGRLDRAAQPRAAGPHPAATWRSRTAAGALFTAAALGVQDVLEPDERPAIIEEIDEASLISPTQPVVYFHVPGAPRLSRAIVRPWLLAPR